MNLTDSLNTEAMVERMPTVPTRVSHKKVQSQLFQ